MAALIGYRPPVNHFHLEKQVFGFDRVCPGLVGHKENFIGIELQDLCQLPTFSSEGTFSPFSI